VGTNHRARTARSRAPSFCPDDPTGEGCAVRALCARERAVIRHMKPRPDESDTQVWRPSRALRSAGHAGAVGALVLGASVIAVAASEGAWLEGVGFVAAFFLAPAAVGLRYARRARLELTRDGLVVVTTFSEHRIPWAEISDAKPGYAGIAILLRNGDSVLAGAVQKSNVSEWLHRRTRADELADRIVRRAGGTS
jgi:Bacterial PH domain